MSALRDIEEWTGHKQPGGSFPWIRLLIAILFAVTADALITSCAGLEIVTHSTYGQGQPSTKKSR